MTELTLIIPIEPPSGNHYKSFRVIGKHASWYLTKEAKAWHAAVHAVVSIRDFSEVCSVRLSDTHAVEYTVSKVMEAAGTWTTTPNAFSTRS